MYVMRMDIMEKFGFGGRHNAVTIHLGAILFSTNLMDKLDSNGIAFAQASFLQSNNQIAKKESINFFSDTTAMHSRLQ